MRQVHGWSNEEAKKVKNLYGLRKSYISKNKPTATATIQARRTKACPVYGCRSVIKNLSKHIKKPTKLIHGAANTCNFLKVQ